MGYVSIPTCLHGYMSPFRHVSIPTCLHSDTLTLNLTQTLTLTLTSTTTPTIRRQCRSGGMSEWIVHPLYVVFFSPLDVSVCKEEISPEEEQGSSLVQEEPQPTQIKE